jgi:hypothetical protein
MKLFFKIFYYSFDKCIYIKNSLLIIWLIIKINMIIGISLMSCHCLDLLCTNTLVRTCFWKCKLSIKKIDKLMLSSKRVNIWMCIRIQDIHFVFVFENIWICIHIRVKMRQKVLSESNSMRIRSISFRSGRLLLGPGVGKNSLIMNNPDLKLRKSILTKNDAITQHKWTRHILRNYSQFLRSELTNASKK